MLRYAASSLQCCAPKRLVRPVHFVVCFAARTLFLMAGVMPLVMLHMLSGNFRFASPSEASRALPNSQTMCCGHVRERLSGRFRGGNISNLTSNTVTKVVPSLGPYVCHSLCTSLAEFSFVPPIMYTTVYFSFLREQPAAAFLAEARTV